MQGTPYRHRSASSISRLSTGWITDASVFLGIAGLALCSLAVLGLCNRDSKTRLDCDATGCQVEQRHDRHRLPRDGVYVVSVMAQTRGMRGPVAGTYFVQVLGTKAIDIGMVSQEHAESMARELRRALREGDEVHRVYSVGEDATIFVFPLLLMGILLLAMWCFRRGVYEFTLDRENDMLSVRRLRGLVPGVVANEPLSAVAEVVAEADRPDNAFSRYRVVLRLRNGEDVVAVPLALRRAAARAIATRVDSALQSSRAVEA